MNFVKRGDKVMKIWHAYDGRIDLTKLCPFIKLNMIINRMMTVHFYVPEPCGFLYFTNERKVVFL